MGHPNSLGHSSIDVAEMDSFYDLASQFELCLPEEVGILPQNFFIAGNSQDLIFQSTALEVQALLKEASINITLAKPNNLQPIFRDDRDGTWVAPIFFFAGSFALQNQTLIGITLNVISNYIYEFFKGNPTQPPSVQFKCIVEKTRTKKYVQIEFTGPPGELPGVEKIIKDTLK